MYDELKAKGVDFPMTDLDAMAPIYKPKKSVLSTPAQNPVPAQPDRQHSVRLEFLILFASFVTYDFSFQPSHYPQQQPPYPPPQQQQQQRRPAAESSDPVHLSPE